MEIQRRSAVSTGRREVALACAVSALLSTVMTWPLLPRLRTHVLKDVGDPLLQAWQLAWVGHALRDGDAELFQANTHWPLPDTLAFSDALLGYAPAGLVGSGLTAATVRYGLLVLFASTLAAVGAYLLARELGARPLAASLAGVVFAWAPWRLAHAGHLNVLSSGGIPLSFFLLVRGYRQRRWGLVLAGWLVSAWQVSIGFALGVFFAYALATVGVLAALWWWRAGRPTLGAPVVRATVGGLVVLLAWTAVQATPYLRVLDTYPEAARGLTHVEVYAPPPSGLVAAPAASRMWGEVTAPVRDRLRAPTEQTRFPGAVALVLAVAGAVVGSGPARIRRWLVAGVVVTTLLLLGTSTALTRPLYELLFEVAPGWDALRTPGRLITLVSLGLGLLAALAADRLLDGDVGADVGRRSWRVAVVGLLVAGAVVEGLGDVPVVAVPEVDPIVVVAAGSPRLHLPSDDSNGQRYMLWSTIDGLAPVVNGSSGVRPRALDELRQQVAGFPDATSVAVLRELGVASVVLHLDLAPGTPWEGAEVRPVAGLGITRLTFPDAVVFQLDP